MIARLPRVRIAAAAERSHGDESLEVISARLAVVTALAAALPAFEPPLPVRRPTEATDRSRAPSRQHRPTCRPPETDGNGCEKEKPDWMRSRVEAQRSRGHQSEQGPAETRETG